MKLHAIRRRKRLRTQPVDVFNRYKLLHQRSSGADDHSSGIGLDPHHIEGLSPSEPESAALADGEIDDAVVPAENPAIHMHDLARLCGLGPELQHDILIPAARHEADVLTVGLLRYA